MKFKLWKVLLLLYIFVFWVVWTGSANEQQIALANSKPSYNMPQKNLQTAPQNQQPAKDLQRLFSGMSDFDLSQIWSSLPRENQKRVKTLIKTGVSKIPQQHYDQILDQLRRGADLLREKHGLVMYYLKQEYPGQEDLYLVYPVVLGLFQQGINLSSLEYQQILRGNWNRQIENEIGPYLRRTAFSLNNQTVSKIYADYTGENLPFQRFALMKKLAIQGTRIDGQNTYVQVSNGSQISNIQMVKVGEKWLPLGFAREFTLNYNQGARAVNNFNLFSEENDLQITLALGYFENCLAQLEQAQTVDDIRSIHQSFLAVVELVRGFI